MGTLPLRNVPASLVLLAALLTTGCTRYVAKPLDLSHRISEFNARTAASAVDNKLQPLTDVNVTLAGVSAHASTVTSITLRDAEICALLWNPQLNYARTQAGISQATSKYAGLWDDPQLGADIMRILDSDVENRWKTGVSLGFTLPVSGRLRAQRSQANAQHAAELEKIYVSEWEARMAVRDAWITVAALDETVAQYHNYLSAFDKVVEVISAMENAGELSRAELRLFTIERASTLLSLETAIAERETAQLHLLSTIGLPPHTQLTLSYINLDADVTQSELSAVASSAVRIAAAEYEVSERALALEVRKQYPDITLGPAFAREDGSNQAGIGFSIPLPLLNRNKGGIAQASATRDAAAANVQAALEHATAKIALLRRTIEAARKRVSHLETNLLPLVEAQATDTQRIAELGEVGALVLLDSFKRRHEVNITLIEARKSLRGAQIELRAIVPEKTSTITEQSSK